jgi:hypothetical protein
MGRGQRHNATIQSGTAPMVIPMDEKTLSVPEAGKRYFDLSRNASYVAVRLGMIPVIKFGKKLRVPVIALERMLQEARPLIPGED